MSESVPVYVGFSRPRGWFKPFAWTIMLVERRRFSHVYLRWHSTGADSDIVYHASGTQVHFLAFEFFMKKAIIVEEYLYDLPKDHYKDLLKFCMRHAGVDYGTRGVFGIAWVKFAELFKRQVGNPLDSSTQWCSKLIAQLLLGVGVDTKIDAGTAGPSSIQKFVNNSPLFSRVK